MKFDPFSWKTWLFLSTEKLLLFLKQKKNIIIIIIELW